MTPRKRIFNHVKEALKSISEIEMIDLQRNQMADPKKSYPTLFTTALVSIKNIDWQSMTNSIIEGKTIVEVSIYIKDGWIDHHDESKDEYNEIDLIDKVVESLQGLIGEGFRPLELISENIGQDFDEMMEYKLEFSTKIYQTINNKYVNKSIKIS